MRCSPSVDWCGYWQRRARYLIIMLGLSRISRIGPHSESSAVFETRAYFIANHREMMFSQASRHNLQAVERVDFHGSLTYQVAIPNRQAKFRELIVFLAEECRDDPMFGATKLNKLMWRADFVQFFRTGLPITGAKYQRLKNGPAPQALLAVKRELINEGAVTEERRDVGGYQQKRLTARRRPDVSVFSESELDLIRSLVKENWGKSATAMSNDSHGLAWKTRTNGELIPYEAEYISDEPVTVRDIERTRQLVAELGLPDGKQAT